MLGFFHWPESTYIHQLHVLRGWVGMVRPVGNVHHVVPLRSKTLPQPVMKLFPLLPGHKYKMFTVAIVY